MQITQVSTDLGDPGAPGWSAIASEDVSLAPVPIDSQPTEYIRTKWANLPYGNVSTVKMAAAHDGVTAWVRLEWSATVAERNEFPDGAGLYCPNGEGASAATIGSAEAPVDLVVWHAGRGARALRATGPGCFRPVEDGAAAQAVQPAPGRWSVVFAQQLDAVRTAGRIGVVVWDGACEERAGIGAATPDWLEVTIGS